MFLGERCKVAEREGCCPADNHSVDPTTKQIAGKRDESQGRAAAKYQHARFGLQDSAGNRNRAYQDKDSFQEASPPFLCC